jgi:hypothetical protein
MHLNGTTKLLIPAGAILALVVGLHAVQQRDVSGVRDEVSEVRTSAVENQTQIARDGAKREAQFDEIMRSLERIEDQLE